jgi:hypothetical protein
MKKTSSGGYVVVLLLFIGVVLMIFLMVQQYTKIGVRNQETLNAESAHDAQGNPVSTHPIDRALDIKATVEARDRAMLGQ